MFSLSRLDSPHQLLFMGQGCVLSPAQKGGRGAFLMSRVVFCAAFLLFWSSPFEVGASCSQGDAFPRRFWTQLSLFAVWFSCACSEALLCRERFSSLCFVWYLGEKEEKKTLWTSNPSIVPLSLLHILWPFHQARGVSTAGISRDQLRWVPALASYDSCVLLALSQEAHYLFLCLFSWNT